MSVFFCSSISLLLNSCFIEVVGLGSGNLNYLNIHSNECAFSVCCFYCSLQYSKNKFFQEQIRTATFTTLFRSFLILNFLDFSKTVGSTKFLMIECIFLTTFVVSFSVISKTKSIQLKEKHHGYVSNVKCKILSQNKSK